MTSKNEAQKTPIIRDSRLNPTLKKILPLTNPSTNTPTHQPVNKYFHQSQHEEISYGYIHSEREPQDLQKKIKKIKKNKKKTL
jgi:hypothetical protein